MRLCKRRRRAYARRRFCMVHEYSHVRMVPKPVRPYDWEVDGI